MGISFSSDEGAWADYLISRAGLLIFCTILLISASRIQPLFIQKDTAGRLDASVWHLVSFLESGNGVQGPYYYRSDVNDEVFINISTRYVTATKGTVTRGKGLMTPVYPPNGYWNNRTGLLLVIADMCQGRTGTGEDVLRTSDIEVIDDMLEQIEMELASSPFSPDHERTLIAERVSLDYQGPGGIERRDITIVYQ